MAYGYMVMDMPFEYDATSEFGSIRLVETKQKNVRNYVLNSTDKDKLNKITNANSGSMAYCTDTKELLMYNKADKVWHEV